jgi:tRNA threonylcarbamoyladenosine biosynthesis protein TsaE
LKIDCLIINDLPDVTKQILSYGKDFKIWILKGDLGAGKTTFIQEVAKQMGISEYTSSPSYAIINEYLTHSAQKIYHFDLFRINTIAEVLDIGFDEYLDSGSYCFIEWPEIAEQLLPARYLEVRINNPEKELREFNIIKHE